MCVCVKVCVCVHANWLKGGMVRAHNFQMESQTCTRFNGFNWSLYAQANKKWAWQCVLWTTYVSGIKFYLSFQISTFVIVHQVTVNKGFNIKINLQSVT